MWKRGFHARVDSNHRSSWKAAIIRKRRSGKGGSTREWIQTPRSSLHPRGREVEKGVPRASGFKRFSADGEREISRGKGSPTREWIQTRTSCLDDCSSHVEKGGSSREVMENSVPLMSPDHRFPRLSGVLGQTAHISLVSGRSWRVQRHWVGPGPLPW